MHRRRAALLTTLTATVTMALSSGTASAAEVVNEATGVHCSAITENDAPATPEISGGCPIRGTGTDFEFGGPFGIMITCDITAEGKVSEAGAGIGMAAAAGWTCETGSKSPCTGAADAHGSSSAVGGAASPYTFTASFCVVAFGLTNRCANVPGTAIEGPAHTYSAQFVHTNRCSNGVNSLQGQINQVVDISHPKIEVR